MASKVVASSIILIFGLSSVTALVRRNFGIEANPIRIIGRPPESSLVIEDRVSSKTLDQTFELSQHSDIFNHDKVRSKFGLKRLFRSLRKKWRSSTKLLREFIQGKESVEKKKIFHPSNTIDREKLDVMQQDFMEISRINTELREKYDEIQEQEHSRQPEVYAAENVVSKILKSYHENLSHVRYLKLVELLPGHDERLIQRLYPRPKGVKKSDSKVPDLPRDIIDSISQMTMKNVGDSIVQSFGKLVDDAYVPLILTLTGSTELQAGFWAYILQSWDFLIKHQFLTPSAVGDFFDKHRNASELLRFYAASIALDDKKLLENQLFLLGSHRLTEHWYWKLLHGSLKGLSEKSQDELNTHVLKTRYREEIFRLVVYDESQTWDGLIRSFMCDLERDCSDELDALIELIASTNHRLLNPHQSTLEGRNFRKIMVYCCDYWAHLEAKLGPETIAERLGNHPRAMEFTNRYNLFEISAQMDSFHRRAESFYKQHVLKTVDWKKSSIFKSTFEDHLKKFNVLFGEIQRNRYRVHEEPNYLGFLGVIEDTVKYFKGVRTSLEKKLDTFAVSEQ